MLEKERQWIGEKGKVIVYASGDQDEEEEALTLARRHPSNKSSTTSRWTGGENDRRRS